VLVYDQLGEIPSGQRAIAIGNRHEKLELCATTTIRLQPFNDSIPLRAAEIVATTTFYPTELERHFGKMHMPTTIPGGDAAHVHKGKAFGCGEIVLLKAQQISIE
jgi:hypothetical protein